MTTLIVSIDGDDLMPHEVEDAVRRLTEFLRDIDLPAFVAPLKDVFPS